MGRIIVAGSVLVDRINEVVKYPNSGELAQIVNVSKSVGGLVANDGIDIKKIDKNIDVCAISKIGNDDDGKFIAQTLGSFGIDIKGLKTSNDDSTSFTNVVSVKGGERTFFTYSGTCKTFGYDDIDFDNLKADLFHLGYFMLLDKVDSCDGLKILKKVKSLGIKTSIDLVSSNSGNYQQVLPCLEYTDNLIVNEIEAGKLANTIVTDNNIKDVLKNLIKQGVKERVIIHKPDYSVCLNVNGEYTFVPSLQIPSEIIKGTTGAGDAFCSGCLVKILQGATDREILEFASMSAVTSLTEKDATSGIKSEKEIIEFCRQFKRREICL